MASSVTKANNPHQGGKEDKDKNKNIMVLADERLAEMYTSMSTLTTRVEDMNKCIEELWVKM